MDQKICHFIHQKYKIKVQHIKLLRESIGFVYVVETLNDRYIFKLYRKKTQINVESTVQIMHFLSKRGVNVPTIIEDQNKNLCVVFQGQLGVLFEYIEGSKIIFDQHLEVVKHAHHRLVEAMMQYSGNIPKKDRDFYIERYLRHLDDVNYSRERIQELRVMGYDLYKHMMVLNQGFIHGDFHNENMIINNAGEVIFLDFDACGMLASPLDLVVFLDQTDFNHFKEVTFLKTVDLIKLNLTKETNMKALIAFIAVRHYELIATIIHERRINFSDFSFYDQQYQWVKSFYQSWIDKL